MYQCCIAFYMLEALISVNMNKSLTENHEKGLQKSAKQSGQRYFDLSLQLMALPVCRSLLFLLPSLEFTGRYRNMVAISRSFFDLFLGSRPHLY